MRSTSASTIVLLKGPWSFDWISVVKLIGLDLAVALEGDAIDEVVFDDADDDAAAGMRYLNVREQAGGIERLDARVDRDGVGPGE